jgi:hypothetical protein
MHTPANPLRRFEHDDAMSGLGQPARGSKPGDSGSQYNYICCIESVRHDGRCGSPFGFLCIPAGKGKKWCYPFP